MMKCFLSVLFLLFFVSPVSALEIGGVQLPDSVNLAGRTLTLNGAGLRTKLFFKIYAGGLYLVKPLPDAQSIINADEPMLVRMHFIYDGVSAEKLQDGWKDGFALTVPDADENLQQEIVAFTGLFKEQVQENDVYDISWLPGKGVEIRFNGKMQGEISGLDFKKGLFAIWFGKDPVDDDLKEGMLGR
ncbi:MAG: chalcone isomerase family protein [Thermodesulfobacteriota bacterium]|nr:chalcone isomerase family protein [Thermodesulfobacteriota bacterium]